MSGDLLADLDRVGAALGLDRPAALKKVVRAGLNVFLVGDSQTKSEAEPPAKNWTMKQLAEEVDPHGLELAEQLGFTETSTEGPAAAPTSPTDTSSVAEASPVPSESDKLTDFGIGEGRICENPFNGDCTCAAHAAA